MEKYEALDTGTRKNTEAKLVEAINRASTLIRQAESERGEVFAKSFTVFNSVERATIEIQTQNAEREMADDDRYFDHTENGKTVRIFADDIERPEGNMENRDGEVLSGALWKLARGSASCVNTPDKRLSASVCLRSDIDKVVDWEGSTLMDINRWITNARNASRSAGKGKRGQRWTWFSLKYPIDARGGSMTSTQSVSRMWGVPVWPRKATRVSCSVFAWGCAA